MRLAAGIILGVITLVSESGGSSSQIQHGRYSGSNVVVTFPKAWDFVESQNHRQVYAVPAQEDRGGIYINNVFEPSSSGARAGLEKTHAKYVKNGQSRSDIQTRKTSKGTYIWFDYKAPVRKFETYSKGYMIFNDGKAVLIHVIKLDGDKAIGKEMDAVVATISER